MKLLVFAGPGRKISIPDRVRASEEVTSFVSGYEVQIKQRKPDRCATYVL